MVRRRMHTITVMQWLSATGRQDPTLTDDGPSAPPKSQSSGYRASWSVAGRSPDRWLRRSAISRGSGRLFAGDEALIAIGDVVTDRRRAASARRGALCAAPVAIHLPGGCASGSAGGASMPYDMIGDLPDAQVDRYSHHQKASLSRGVQQRVEAVRRREPRVRRRPRSRSSSDPGARTRRLATETREA